MWQILPCQSNSNSSSLKCISADFSRYTKIAWVDSHRLTGIILYKDSSIYYTFCITTVNNGFVRFKNESGFDDLTCLLQNCSLRTMLITILPIWLISDLYVLALCENKYIVSLCRTKKTETVYPRTVCEIWNAIINYNHKLWTMEL